MDQALIQQGVRLILEGMGEDPDREGLLQTPARVARAALEICGGMEGDASSVFGVTFEADHHEPVLVRDIPFYSMCEHHLLPFMGVAHVAYLPGEDGRVCGISKLARCVELYARRLQLQERLCAQVADALMDNLKPRGVYVQLEAEHMCMSMRGVGKPGSATVTVAKRGLYADDPASASAIASLIAQGRSL